MPGERFCSTMPRWLHHVGSVEKRPRRFEGGCKRASAELRAFVGFHEMSERTTDLAVPFAERVWTVDGERVRFMTIPFPTRMSVIKLASGDLWVHSPVPPTEQRCRSVEELGPVRHIVAPNKIHSLGVEPWKRLYPEATVWASPEFKSRHPHLPVDKVLTDVVPEEWCGEFEQAVFGGSPVLDEVVFCHKPTRTLIVTDLIQRHDPSQESAFWRAVKGWVGVLGERGGFPRDVKMTVRDRKAARASAEEILAWDFDRLIVCHGLCADAGARAIVERALSWTTP